MADFFPLNIDDIIDVRVSIEQKGLEKANANRILILTDEPNKSRKLSIRATNLNMILDEYSPNSNVGIVAKAIYGQTVSVRDGGGDVLVVSTVYMDKQRTVTNWTMSMPSSETLATLDEFSIAWRIDDGDLIETTLPIDKEKWVSIIDTQEREDMFLKALNKVFSDNFKVFKDDVILVFQKHEDSIISKIEFFHPEGLHLTNLKELQKSINTFINGEFYKKVIKININSYNFNNFDEYKTIIEVIPNEVLRLKDQLENVKKLTKDESILKIWVDTIKALDLSNEKIKEVINHIKNNIDDADELCNGLITFKKNEGFIENEIKIKTISELNFQEIQKVEDYFKAILKDAYTILNFILKLYECNKTNDYKSIDKNCGFLLSPKYTDVIDFFNLLYKYLDDIKLSYRKLDEDFHFIHTYKNDLDYVINQTEWKVVYNDIDLINKLSNNVTDLQEPSRSIIEYTYKKEDIKTKLLDEWLNHMKAEYTLRKPVIEKAKEFIDTYDIKISEKFPYLSTYERYKRRLKGVKEVVLELNTNPLYYNKVVDLIVNGSINQDLLKYAKTILDKERNKDEIKDFLIKIMSDLTGKPGEEEIKKDAEDLTNDVFNKLERSPAYDWILKIGEIIKIDACDENKLKRTMLNVKSDCKALINEKLEKIINRDTDLVDSDLLEWEEKVVKCIDDDKSASAVLSNWVDRLNKLLWDGWIKEQVCPKPIKIKKDKAEKWGVALTKANLSANLSNSVDVMKQALTVYIPEDKKYDELRAGADAIAKKKMEKDNVYNWFLKACPVVDVYTKDKYKTEATAYTNMIKGYYKPSKEDIAEKRFNDWLKELKTAVDSNDNQAVKDVFMQYKEDIATNQQHSYEAYIDGLLKREYNSNYFSDNFKVFILEFFGMKRDDNSLTEYMNAINTIIKKYYKDTEE